jgi:hypothetical protein
MAMPKVEPFAISSKEAARVSGFSIRELQKSAKAGEIPAARKKGRKYVFMVDEFREWVRSTLPTVQPTKAQGN